MCTIGVKIVAIHKVFDEDRSEIFHLKKFQLIKVYMYTHTYLQMKTCKHRSSHTYIYRQTCTHAYKHTHMHTHKRTYIHTYIHAHIHTYIQMYMRACIYPCEEWKRVLVYITPGGVSHQTNWFRCLRGGKSHKFTEQSHIDCNLKIQNCQILGQTTPSAASIPCGICWWILSCIHTYMHIHVHIHLHVYTHNIFQSSSTIALTDQRLVAEAGPRRR